MDDSKSLSIKYNIVHCFKSSVSFLLGIELEVSVTKRFACSFVESHFSALELESSACEEFVEIKIKEVFLWQIADVQTGELILLFLARTRSSWTGDVLNLFVEYLLAW